jgi:hypothetical protein
MILIGIDLSLTSPGLSVLDESDVWYMYAFLQHKKKHKNFKHPLITLLPMIPNSTTSDMIRYQYIVDQIIKIIQFWQTKNSRIKIVIENYAFSAASGNGYKLYELGGIMKYALFFRCQLDCVLLPVKKWKKYAIGNGDATKLEVVQYMVTNGPKLDFMTLLDMKIPPDNIPGNPVQDICDACGLILAYKHILQYGENLKNSKKRKLESEKTTSKKKNTKTNSNNTRSTTTNDKLDFFNPRNSESINFDLAKLFGEC